MLVEVNRVIFCGDYGFETDKLGQSVDQTRIACIGAMSALVEEGLVTASRI